MAGIKKFDTSELENLAETAARLQHQNHTNTDLNEQIFSNIYSNQVPTLSIPNEENVPIPDSIMMTLTEIESTISFSHTPEAFEMIVDDTLDKTECNLDEKFDQCQTVRKSEADSAEKFSGFASPDALCKS